MHNVVLIGVLSFCPVVVNCLCHRVHVGSLPFFLLQTASESLLIKHQSTPLIVHDSN